MIRVAVAGARGKMGALAVDTLKAAGDVQYVGGFARSADEKEHIYTDIHRLLAQRKPEVVVDFTTHPITVDIATACVVDGVSPVVGSSAWTAAERDALATLAKKNNVGAMIVPNFAVGAVLMMRFAEQASRFFPSVEVIEKHRIEKLDKPSGTARETAARIKAVTGRDVPIHSVRLHGLLAHQEVQFGTTGESFTIRHDSLSRESFATGILFAVRAVRSQKGLTIGLDSLIEEKLQ
ncbi:MAG: 4-hydroxy-tetrahydrodipicolinate reductase [Candidatus Eremiobacteraeota bacterium]|nr:4-hydroxy-tetrahydrodipicolinate reductase [Candidatus Eremiobacteraeota bacterium]